MLLKLMDYLKDVCKLVKYPQVDVLILLLQLG